jgi:hypothetical protein
VELIAPETVTGQAGRVTVCLFAEATYPSVNNAAFFDDARFTVQPQQ